MVFDTWDLGFDLGQGFYKMFPSEDPGLWSFVHAQLKSDRAVVGAHEVRMDAH